MRRSRPRLPILVAALALAGVTPAAGCAKKEPEPSATPPAAAKPAPHVVAAGDTGARGDAAAAAGPPMKAGTATVKGTVTLTGKIPESKMLNRGGDPFCAKTPMHDEEVMVGPGGTLKNVLVRITKGIAGNYEPPMTNVTLDQTACMYRPRVQGMMSGQSLLIRNSDQTLHNVHAYKGPSTLFNQAEVPGLPPIAKKFNNAGDILKFKCDVHPWMTAYVGVSNHPFFAVTGDDGTFSIPKVPAGKYTLEAWHERYGAKTAEITVEADAPMQTDFAFSAK